MKVLFLDIDGVLNGHEWDDDAKSCNIRRECVKHLNRVVQETGCKIVVSSAWRYILLAGDMTTKGFGYMLRTHGLIAPGGSMNLIVGYTGRDATDADPARSHERDGERGRQCRAWLDWWAGLPGEGPTVTSFAAVDDDDDGFAEAGIPAVITDGRHGLTCADTTRLIALLGSPPDHNMR